MERREGSEGFSFESSVITAESSFSARRARRERIRAGRAFEGERLEASKVDTEVYWPVWKAVWRFVSSAMG